MQIAPLPGFLSHEKEQFAVDDRAARAGLEEGRNGLEDPRLLIESGRVLALWSASRLGAADLGAPAPAPGEAVFPDWSAARSTMAVGAIVDGAVADLRLLPSPHGRSREKNWMPFLDGGALRVLYHPATMEICDVTPAGLSGCARAGRAHRSLARWSGSSQLIRWGEGWLGVAHFAGRHLHRFSRALGPYYAHRFFRLSARFDVVALSAPFFFERRGVEFCAGLAAHDGRALISYGVEDARGVIIETTRERIDAMLSPV